MEDFGGKPENMPPQDLPAETPVEFSPAEAPAAVENEFPGNMAENEDQSGREIVRRPSMRRRGRGRGRRDKRFASKRDLSESGDSDVAGEAPSSGESEPAQEDRRDFQDEPEPPKDPSTPNGSQGSEEPGAPRPQE
jgi:hypothetical protein